MNELIIALIMCIIFAFACMVCAYMEAHPNGKLSRLLDKIDELYYGKDQ